MPVPSGGRSVSNSLEIQQGSVLQTRCFLLTHYSPLTTHHSLFIAYCSLLSHPSSLIPQRLPHRRGHFRSQQFNRTQYLIMGHGAKTHLRQETRMSKEFVFI